MLLISSELLLQVDNFIHADMHPGNILVRKKASRGGLFKTKKPHIVFLDVGMTAELSKNDRENLLDFFKAVARRDGRTAAERTLKLSRKQNCPNPEAFIEVIIYLLQASSYPGKQLNCQICGRCRSKFFIL